MSGIVKRLITMKKMQFCMYIREDIQGVMVSYATIWH